MLTGHIANATRILGAPRDWDKKKHGACGGLAIRDERTTAGDAMTSAWYPNTEELARLAAGAPVYLSVYGGMHPPVSLNVGPAPE